MNLPPLAAPAARPVPASRARLWGQRLTLLTVVTLLLLGTLELLLAFAPGLFGEQRLNEVYSRYDIRPGGIYVRERRAGLRFMWPDFSTENYWNGYRWQHSTDSRGFRNPPGTPTEVLLLGDSLIYGHGVEEPETVSAFCARSAASAPTTWAARVRRSSTSTSTCAPGCPSSSRGASCSSSS